MDVDRAVRRDMLDTDKAIAILIKRIAYMLVHVTIMMI
jgi:hypothetical protein